ncbi:uncharacterized protein E5676_scaffold434G001950 [Cucumis melo var. makuwa]|uniref:Uncharacterized protein n=1 Tax=Cucumis melo var. makuwa TaxID=1194695 RepID=A0A5A7U1V8_CUCMM|nr:uncharacterized protein E6C27_scaffold171G004580 [Cucumis melo var. makuwa]TYK17340.1 uncharacterized protein E5676_scaffold434G001950 [Cucumis melo var. makuwa]
MDGDSKDVNGCKEKTMDSAAAGEVGDHSNGEEYSESNALLPPRRGGMSRKLNKPRMKVRWNDSNGNNLAEILEFQPSDVSDSGDEEADSCSYCCATTTTARDVQRSVH